MSASLSWSYSAIQDFMGCARRYNLVRVKKVIVRHETEEMKYGVVVHKALEDRLINNVPLPDHLAHLDGFVARIQQTEGEVFAEENGGKMTIDAAFEPCDWFAKTAWCRAVVDVGVKHYDVVWQGDYKTGKRRPGSDQLMLSAALKMHSDPDVNVVKTSYIWIRDKKMDDGGTYTRDMLPEMWQHFLPKVRKLELAFEKDAWPPKPGPLCAWCPASKRDCEYAKK